MKQMVCGYLITLFELSLSNLYIRVVSFVRIQKQT